MCGEIRISAALISASETIHEKGIREVMRVTSKKLIQGSSLQIISVIPALLKKRIH